MIVSMGSDHLLSVKAGASSLSCLILRKCWHLEHLLCLSPFREYPEVVPRPSGRNSVLTLGEAWSRYPRGLQPSSLASSKA